MIENLIIEVKKTIEAIEGFSIESIFPFYLHSTRINLSEIELIDNEFGTDFKSFIMKNGYEIDCNRNLWSLYETH